MSRINNQLQHRISELTQLGMKKVEAQAITKAIHEAQYGSLKGYISTKTYMIRSINTAKAYRNSAEQFATWLKDIKGINKINKVTRAVAGEYLQQRDKINSAWTTKKDLAAINKIFDYKLTSKELGLKKRKIKDIKRSRKGPDKSRPGLLIKYKEQILFIMACGCRRDSITRVTYQDIVFENGIAVAVNLVEKGGKPRTAPILESHQIEFTAMIEKYRNTTNTNIFKSFDNHVSAHYYRHLYAMNLYEELLSKDGSPEHVKYKGYDSVVLGEVSKALGHGEGRLYLVVNNYFY